MLEITPEILRQHLLRRENDSHKHQYGHALIVAGCSSMPGAAVMATGAALHSGCGLVTLHSCKPAAGIAAQRYPSAMLSVDESDVFSRIFHEEDIKKYSAIGVGPGLGRDPRTEDSLYRLVQAAGSKELSIPMVLDADALNIMSEHINLYWSTLPKGSVLTPHEGELRRLCSMAGKITDDMILEYCGEHETTLVRKGYHTRIYGPDGNIYENTTGNPGMAKGGSGDVLTGLITGLMARGYSGLHAALLGVWIHGYAGDMLSEEKTTEGYCAQEILDYLYMGFKALYDDSSVE